VNQSNFSQAYKYLYWGEEIAISASSLNQMEYAKRRISWVHYRRGNCEQALKKLNELPGIISQVEDESKKFRYYNAKGVYLRCLSDYAGAKAALDSALTIAINLNSLSNQAHVLTNLSECYGPADSLDKCIGLIDEAFEINTQIKSDRNIASNHRTYGKLFFQKGEFQKAQSHLLKAEKSFIAVSIQPTAP